MLFRLMTILMVLGISALFANEKDAMALGSTAAQEWLALVDQGRYADSWASASPRLQITMPKAEWEKVLQAMRAPLGPVKSREMALQRPAQNPQGLPAGDYMIIVYKTTFANRGKPLMELVTLSLGYDGKWHVLTYLIKDEKDAS